MGIAYINGDNSVNNNLAVVRRNDLQNPTLDHGLDGDTSLSVDLLNARYDKDNQPLAVHHMTVTTAGRYVMPDASGAISKFVFYSNGDNVYAGINASTTGDFAVGNGLYIPSGSSYEFGENDSQIIRNVWAITSTGSSRVNGYSTNIASYI